MKAIILAAGRGSRMKNLTANGPKCMVKLNGKSLLERQIEALEKAKIDEIAIVTGYKRECIGGHGTKEFHNQQWAKTNMVTSLACAREWLLDEPCIVSYSDIFYEHTAIESLMSEDAYLAITYDPNWLSIWEQRFKNPLSDAETFRLNLEGELIEIGNKPSTTEEIQGQYMGLLRFTPTAWKEVERLRLALDHAARDKIDMTSMLQKIITANNINIKALEYNGYWGEIELRKGSRRISNSLIIRF